MPPPPNYAPAAAPAYSGQTTYAGFWIRVVARLVDGLLLGIPFSILFGIFAAAGGLFASTSNSNSQSSNGAAAALFGGAFVLFYLIALWVTFGYWVHFPARSPLSPTDPFLSFS